MLIDFFYTLRSAKLPVSVKEYLSLLEALQSDPITNAWPIARLARDGWAAPMDPVFPAVSCTAQATLTTGGPSSPSVFQTTPPQPASKARRTL